MKNKEIIFERIGLVARGEYNSNTGSWKEKR